MASRSMARRCTTRVPSSRVGHVTRADRRSRTLGSSAQANSHLTEADQLVPCRRNWRTAKISRSEEGLSQGCRSLRSFHPAPSRIRAARAAYPQATTTALETRSSAGTANEPCRIPGRLQGRPSPREPNRGPASTSSQPCRWGARPRAAIPTSSRPSTAVEPLRIPHRGKTGALARRRNAARVPRARRPRRVDCP